MQLTRLPEGAHFWALMDGLLVMGGKFGGEYYVCGGWEGAISENQLSFIQIAEFPEGFNADQLYYKP